jgi:hypothetical protein
MMQFTCKAELRQGLPHPAVDRPTDQPNTPGVATDRSIKPKKAVNLKDGMYYL